MESKPFNETVSIVWDFIHRKAAESQSHLRGGRKVLHILRFFVQGACPFMQVAARLKTQDAAAKFESLIVEGRVSNCLEASTNHRFESCRKETPAKLAC